MTAASRGLGFSVAKSLSDEGAHVIICSRNESALRKAVGQLGPKARYIVTDVSKREEIVNLLADIRRNEGVLDGLYINAGGPSPGTFDKLDDNDWRAAFELTLMSAVRLTKEALPLLQKGQTPAVLYSTSISVKQPIDNLLLSNSLRPAVIGMMRTLADEIGPEGIRINAICPGYILTERVEELMEASGDAEASIDRLNSIIPLRRMGLPSEFGPVCTFLLSPVASYIHGALLLIDGGLYRGMM